MYMNIKLGVIICILYIFFPEPLGSMLHISCPFMSKYFHVCFFRTFTHNHSAIIKILPTIAPKMLLFCFFFFLVKYLIQDYTWY